MKPVVRTAIRILVTVLMVVGACLAGHYLWQYYKVDPWTRNGRVRADAIQITPDVTGLVTEVRVRDNERVARGQVLFVIDHPRFALAREQAAANVRQLDIQIDQARRENARNRRLTDLVSNEAREESQMKVDALNANRRQAQAALDTADLNLTRTEVLAPTDGIVSNIELQPGDYATAGHPVFALIDTASLRVEGYFEETKIPRIHVGDAVEVVLMGESKVIHGHVESISGGIEDRDTVSSPRLLANVNPTFNWVRLAQRIPVRVKLDAVPGDILPIAGRTATVRVKPTLRGDHR
ncbi:MAG: HlyD family secretion protein [Luteibacter sp.]